MKQISSFIVACMVFFSQGKAQTQSTQRPGPAEQKEIKADLHLEKELQRKQLTGKPQVLNDTNAVSQKKKVAGKAKKKCTPIKRP